MRLLSGLSEGLCLLGDTAPSGLREGVKDLLKFETFDASDLSAL